jgi:ditrans,polycis-polyprenyl diphosphate synthase
MELGVTTISVYAFSIDNFKRSEAEVEFLMSLFQEKFRSATEVGSAVDKHADHQRHRHVRM